MNKQLESGDVNLLKQVQALNDKGVVVQLSGIYEIELHDLRHRGYLYIGSFHGTKYSGYFLTAKAQRALDALEEKP